MRSDDVTGALTEIVNIAAAPSRTAATGPASVTVGNAGAGVRSVTEIEYWPSEP